MPDINRYIGRDMRRVEGWLHDLTARVIATLGQHQTATGIAGALGEIGVHHGKLWLVLDHVATPEETRFAIDLFDRQDLNTDRSGLGNLERFQRNRARFGASGGRLEIIAASSLEITPGQLRERVGEVRLLSVDGGHIAECTVNDLRLAEAVLSKDGIVALDDVFNEHWPGVMTGFANYMQAGDGRLVPFAIVPGKVLLARQQAARYYYDFLRARFAPDLHKTHDFFGRDVPILMRHVAFARRIKSVIQGTALEPLARRIYERFLR
ncbi:MAG: class I SAM-dependent methyltransferase [Alphaproteobacteria bacterium]